MLHTLFSYVKTNMVNRKIKPYPKIMCLNVFVSQMCQFFYTTLVLWFVFQLFIFVLNIFAYLIVMISGGQRSSKSFIAKNTFHLVISFFTNLNKPLAKNNNKKDL